MNTDDLDQSLARTIARLKTSSIKGHFFAGASEAEIAEIEIHLGVGLPYSYRRFLGLLGYVSYRGQEIFGVVPGMPVIGRGSPLVVDVNLTARQGLSRVLPRLWICIAESGNGWCYVLRTEERVLLDATTYECPVDAWFYGDEDSCTERMTSNFADFFASLMNEPIGRD